MMERALSNIEEQRENSPRRGQAQAARRKTPRRTSHVTAVGRGAVHC
jgi:hypothetical protein